MSNFNKPSSVHRESLTRQHQTDSLSRTSGVVGGGGGSMWPLMQDPLGDKGRGGRAPSPLPPLPSGSTGTYLFSVLRLCAMRHLEKRFCSSKYRHQESVNDPGCPCPAQGGPARKASSSPQHSWAALRGLPWPLITSPPNFCAANKLDQLPERPKVLDSVLLSPFKVPQAAEEGQVDGRKCCCGRKC